MSKIETTRSLVMDDHRLIDKATGQVVMRALRGLPERGQNDRYHLMLRDNNLDYFMHDKELGSMDAGDLIDTANHNIQFAQVVSEDHAELGSQYYELAASALWESAFVRAAASDNDVETVDERLRLLDISDSCLQAAIDTLGEEQTATKQRLELKLAFSQVHRDIVCGEITDETVKDLLVVLETELYDTIENIDEVHARGLAGEIRALLTYWKVYQSTGVVAVPSTVRGDSGYFNRNDTHDFDVLRQDEEDNWEVSIPIEVKRRRIAKWMLQRYTGSDLVYVSPISGVHTVQRARRAG